jgi:hypothetical protein
MARCRRFRPALQARPRIAGAAADAPAAPDRANPPRPQLIAVEPRFRRLGRGVPVPPLPPWSALFHRPPAGGFFLLSLGVAHARCDSCLSKRSRCRVTGALLLPARGEKVGMRGPNRRAQTCGAQNRRETPSPSLRSTSPRAAGRGKNSNPFSRCAFASESCPSHAQENPPKQGGGAPTGAPSIAAPRKRMLPFVGVSDAAAASSEAARLSALHRGACHANQCHGSAQAVFPATCVRRVLPTVRCPSPAKHPADRS